MDKVKLYLTILKKHHFWVLCGIVTICGFVSWWMGSQSLATEANSHLSTVKGAYDKVRGITNPVNPSFAAAVEKAHTDLKKQAFKVWQDQYKKQQEILKWPENLGQKEFVDIVQPLSPEQPIPEVLRRRYRNLIFPKAWERLYEIVDMRHFPVDLANPLAAGQMPTGQVPMGQLPMGQLAAPIDPATIAPVGIVEWPEENRTLLVERYKFDPSATPSDVKVRLTQEDLWVLQDMAEVIAETNATVAKRLKVSLDAGNAAVKKIESLDVAQWAIDAAQHDEPMIFSMSPQTTGGPMGMGGSMMPGMGGSMMPGMGGSMMPPMGGSMMPPMADGTAGAAGTAADLAALRDTQLLEGRYLDDLGQPLPAASVQAGGTPPYAEFRQLFVRMRLVVDQRRLPELLAACANARLPIEVRRLRIQVVSEGTTDVTGQVAGGGAMGYGGGAMGFGGGAMGYGGAMGRGLGGGGRFGEPGGMGMEGMKGGGGFGREAPGVGRPAMPSPMMAQPAGDSTFGPGPFDVSLELCGVVTLYNSPVEAKLGTGTAAEPGKKVAGIPTTPVALPSGSQSSGGMRGMGMGGGDMMKGMGGRFGGRE
jgi:hypothetical protein